MDTPTEDAPPLEAVRGDAKTAWIVLGIVELLAAVVAVVVPATTTTAVAELIAVLLLVTGAVRIVHAWQIRHWTASFGDLLLGLLFVATAVLIFARPYVGALSLAMIVGGWCLLVGAMDAVTALRPPRLAGWEGLLGTGLASLLVGMFVLVGWPTAGVQAIGVLAGANLLLDGMGSLIIGFRLPRGELVPA